MAQIEQLVQETIPKPELEEVISNTGLYYGDAARFAPNTGNHTAFVLVNLVTGHEGHTDDYIAGLRAKLSTAIARRRSRLSNRRDHQRRIELRPAAPIDIQVKGPSLDIIRPVAEEIQQQIAQVPNTVDVRIKQGKSYPELHIDVDRTKAAYYGINQDRVIVDVITGISSNLALSSELLARSQDGQRLFSPGAVSGAIADHDGRPAQHSRSSARGRLCCRPPVSPAAAPAAPPWRFRTRPLPDGRLDLSSGFYASGDDRRGPPLLLRDVASLKFKTGPDSVDHYDLSRLINVLVTPVGNDLGHVAKRYRTGFGADRAAERCDRTTPRRSRQHARRDSRISRWRLPLAVLLIYLVMVGLFRSFIDPLIILVAVPLGLDRHGADPALHEHLGQRRVDDRHAHDDGHRRLEQHLAGGLRQPDGARRSHG